MTNRYFDPMERGWNVDLGVTTKLFMGDAKSENIDAVPTLLPVGMSKATSAKPSKTGVNYLVTGSESESA
jgi:hypothetical protein